MIKTAVILAAGFGSRLKNLTKDKPKGFVEIEGISLIERSIKNLLDTGIEKIYIGTGYLNEIYEKFAKDKPYITCIKSENYVNTSSMETLYQFKDIIQEDFLLLESDLLYEKKALTTLINDDKKNIVLGSFATNSNDEVFLEVDENNILINLSKNKNDLNNIYAELVGISKISYELYKTICSLYENEINKKIDYEYILAKSKSFFVKKENIIWCEIDDKHHLKKAEEEIFPKIKANELFIKRNILLNPGPATTTDTVKVSQVVSDICPREKEFGDLMEWVSKELTNLVANNEEYTTILFGGSGTAGVEAVISSISPYDRKILIVNNGAYGERMIQIAKRNKINFVEFKSSPIEPLNLKELEKIIKKDDISHLFVVHNETTTGLLNNLDELGILTKKYNLEFVVDAMSSYAAIPIDMKKQNISYLIASSNKNLQGMAGVSFVIANKNSLNKLKNVEPRSFYLSLYEQYQNFIKTHQMRFTPPVQTLYALKQAIIEAKKEGIENRYKRYSKSWETLTNGLKKLGLKYLVDDKYHSKIITSVFIPDGVDFNDMHDFFYEKGFTIYPGKVEEFNTFRIANIGDIDYRDIEEFLALLKQFIG